MLQLAVCDQLLDEHLGHGEASTHEQSRSWLGSMEERRRPTKTCSGQTPRTAAVSFSRIFASLYYIDESRLGARFPSRSTPPPARTRETKPFHRIVFVRQHSSKREALGWELLSEKTAGSQNGTSSSEMPDVSSTFSSAVSSTGRDPKPSGGSSSGGISLWFSSSSPNVLGAGRVKISPRFA